MIDERNPDRRSRLQAFTDHDHAKLRIATEALRQHRFYGTQRSNPVNDILKAAWALLSAHPELILREIDSKDYPIIKGGE